MSPETAQPQQPAEQQQLARRLCHTMAAIHRRGWCEGTGGNFSCLLSREPLQLLMAPSGVDKGSVRAAQLIVVDDRGEVIQGQGKVSAEFALHRAIVQNCGAGAVLHTHSQAATLLSRQAIGQQEGAQITIEGLEMLKGLEGVRTHDCRIQIPVLANDQNLERLSATALPHLEAAPHGILIAGHGLYAWGSELGQAMRHLEILEFLLEQHWRQSLWNAPVERNA